MDSLTERVSFCWCQRTLAASHGIGTQWNRRRLDADCTLLRTNSSLTPLTRKSARARTPMSTTRHSLLTTVATGAPCSKMGQPKPSKDSPPCSAASQIQPIALLLPVENPKKPRPFDLKHPSPDLLCDPGEKKEQKGEKGKRETSQRRGHGRAYHLSSSSFRNSIPARALNASANFLAPPPVAPMALLLFTRECVLVKERKSSTRQVSAHK
jgi:hypothetical protein